MDDQRADDAGGPEGLPESPRADPMAGELVTETLDYDGGRQVTVYVPPDPPEAVVFAGGRSGISQWGGFLEAAGVPSTMIVGVHGPADETLRLQEYSPVFDAERFAAHARSFVEDVARWARSRLGVALPTERTAVFGVSAGGELALGLGLRHPDIYGAVFSGSPGAGYKPTGVMPSWIPRTYLVAASPNLRPLRRYREPNVSRLQDGSVRRQLTVKRETTALAPTHPAVHVSKKRDGHT